MAEKLKVFRRGAKTWLVRMNDKLLYDVTPATIFDPSVVDGSIQVKIAVDRSGERIVKALFGNSAKNDGEPEDQEPLLVSVRAENAFATERLALVAAADKCYGQIEKYATHWHKLTARLQDAA